MKRFSSSQRFNLASVREEGLGRNYFFQFFFSFQRREFNAEEITALFKYFIGPLCDSVSIGDKLIAPLNLLRLFASWTEVPL